MPLKRANEQTPHHAAFHLGDVLMFEPEVAAVATEASLDVTDAHDELEFKRALDRVDGQLAELLAPAVEPDQEARPSAEALRDALSAFCARYAQNVRRALRGERLIPCRGEVRRREGRSPYTVNRLIGVVGMALSGAALVTVICVTALLLDGVTVLFRFGSFAARGEVAALFVGVAAAWCPLVLEYAIPALPRPVGAPVAGLPHMAAQRSRMGEGPDAHASLSEDTEVPDAAEARE